MEYHAMMERNVRGQINVKMANVEAPVSHAIICANTAMETAAVYKLVMDIELEIVLAKSTVGRTKNIVVQKTPCSNWH